MELTEKLMAGVVRLAEEAADEQGLEGVAREEALVTLIEEIAVRVGDEVARAIMRKKLEVESAAEHRQCPTCGAEGLRKGERERSILTRRGEVEFAEAECYCQRCRRSFFPSVASVGTGR